MRIVEKTNQPRLILPYENSVRNSEQTENDVKVKESIEYLYRNLFHLNGSCRSLRQ